MICWLASYPRSGNTLLRTLLWRCFGVGTYSKYNDETDIGRNARVGEKVGHLRYTGEWADTYAKLLSANELSFVKTHEGPEDKCPAIVVVRNGWAAMISNQHYLKAFAKIDASLPEIILGEAEPFPLWGQMLDFWEPHQRPQTLLVRYEDLLEQAPVEILKIAAFLNLEPQREWQNDFAALQALEPRFFRRGKAAVTLEEFGAENALLFEMLNGDWMSRLGYGKSSLNAGAGAVLRNALRLASEKRENIATRRDAIILEQTRYVEKLKGQAAEDAHRTKEAYLELARLGQVSRDQAAYVASLRDELQSAVSQRQELDNERQRLSTLVGEQKTYIERLIRERSDSSSLAKGAAEEVARLIHVVSEQAKYIDTLVGERSALAARAIETSAEIQRLDALVSEQAAYVGVLEKDRSKLTSEIEAFRNEMLRLPVSIDPETKQGGAGHER